MNTTESNLVLGVDFKISIEKRCIEVVEPTLTAPKNALQCTSREEVETDSKEFFDSIGRRALFVRVINEIQKYDWGLISSEAAYQINIPGYDVSYYYADGTSLKTHILKYYMVCHFISDIAAIIGNTVDTKDADAKDDVPIAPPVGELPPKVPPKQPALHFSRLARWATPIKRWAAPVKRWALPQGTMFPVKNVAWYGLFTVAGCILTLLALQIPHLMRSHAPSPSSAPVTRSEAAVVPGPEAAAPPPQGAVAMPVPVTAIPATAVPPAKPDVAPTAMPAMVMAAVPVPPSPAPEATPAPAAAPAAPEMTGSRTFLLQKALITLGFFHGEPNGLMGPMTRKALADFISVVPPEIARHYGPDSLPMAEAALRGEFSLRKNGQPPSTAPHAPR